MSFNPLKEKGIPLEKQLRNWEEIAAACYDKHSIDAYSRTRQILMNGIEVEGWNFKHNFSRNCADPEILKETAQIRRIEDMQQTTINWFIPAEQTVLETTLGYEQVAVDLTAWLAQNEPDEYVKETLDFGLLEDFDHLYRYSQWAYMQEGLDPDKILHGLTDVFLARPTQAHHNDNAMRVRQPYDKNTASVQTKVNLLTIVSAEQQTHNFYAEHGMMYANKVLRKLYGEIKDVEEEHVTMYESLIDPTESLWEKNLLHEFTEVCNYYTCLQDETDPMLKKTWEAFLLYEIDHLQRAAKLFEKYEKRDAEEIIGTKIVEPNRFMSQKEYVSKIIRKEIDKRLDENMDYTTISKLDENWASYNVREIVSGNGAPSEHTMQIVKTYNGRDVVSADATLLKEEVALLKRALEPNGLAPDTLMPDELQAAIKNSKHVNKGH